MNSPRKQRGERRAVELVDVLGKLLFLQSIVEHHELMEEFDDGSRIDFQPRRRHPARDGGSIADAAPTGRHQDGLLRVDSLRDASEQLRPL